MSLETSGVRKTRTEQAEDPEHIGPLLQHLSVNYEYAFLDGDLTGGCEGRTYACIRHNIEIISQLLYPLHELRARSLQSSDGLELFLLLQQLCCGCCAGHRARQLRLSIRSY